MFSQLMCIVMALSWSELSDDHKIVLLLENLVNKQDQQTPIACRICDQIFFDNRSLVIHFESHFHEDGTFNPRSLVGSSVFSENGIKLFSISSHYTHSSSVPTNALNITVKENLGPCAWKNDFLNSPNLLLGDYLVSSQNSAISRGTFASQPNKSDSHLGIALQPIRPQNFHSPLRPTMPGIFTSKTIKYSDYHFRTNPGTSSQPIQQSSFCSSKAIGVFASQSIPCTSTFAIGTTSRCIPETAPKNVEGPFTNYTKPYIMQLEKPIEEMMADHNDVGIHGNRDEMDLTLKL